VSDECLAAGSIRRARIALAVVAVLLLVGSFAFLVADRQPRARARVTNDVGTTNFGGLVAVVERKIAEQGEQATIRRWEVDHHELPDPEDPPAPAEIPAITQASRVVKRWLLGYLPYDVDDLDAAARVDLVATSTAGLADSLLARLPLIPPTQQQHRPPQGRFLDLIATIAPGGRQATVYVELAYGLERVDLHLTLTRRGERGWLIAALGV
jgi:hypothetical protein